MNEKKRQDLPVSGELWVVATPIGNLSDLSTRASQALANADAVLCEDTRRAAQLLSALGISGKSLERLDAHASETKLARLAERLAAGERFALVSDAGTPAISDPGAAMVRHAAGAGVPVIPIPGPSAVATLLSICGFEETAFAFRGFFPRKMKEKEAEIALASASEAARVFVWYESPQRIVESLEALSRLAPESELVAAKEITKIHERVFRGRAPEVFSAVSAEISREGEKGEWCFAAKFVEATGRRVESSDWVKALQCLLNTRVPASEAAREVSQQFGIPKNEVYSRAISLRELSGK